MEAVPVDDVLTRPADIVAPCALGGVLTHPVVDALACAIVCGGANNQLATVEVDDALAARGVLYAPDFVANAGGILNIAEEFVGYSRDRALDAARGIETTMANLFASARAWGVAPGRAADRIARERIANEPFGSGRWEPGDAAAWTDGRPLRSLRPAQTSDATT